MLENYYHKGRAYLVVICDPTDNHIVDVEIWSTPEWEQSLFLDYPTYVAFMVEASVPPGSEESPFSKAAKVLLKMLVEQYELFGAQVGRRCRYSRLIPFLLDTFISFGVDPHPSMKFNTGARP